MLRKSLRTSIGELQGSVKESLVGEAGSASASRWDRFWASVCSSCGAVGESVGGHVCDAFRCLVRAEEVTAEEDEEDAKNHVYYIFLLLSKFCVEISTKLLIINLFITVL